MLNKIKITYITKTKKGFNALFSDNGFLISVDDFTLAKNHIEIDSELTEIEYENLCKESSLNKAVEKSYRILARRLNSEKELYVKLSKDFDSDTAQMAVDKMRDMNLLNDGDYRAQKAKFMLCSKNKSIAQTKFALVQRGVEHSIIDDVLAEYCMEDESKKIVELIEKKYKSKLSSPQKIIAAMARRGFKYEDIRRRLKTVSGEDFNYREN
jgi:regulatory protein